MKYGALTEVITVERSTQARSAAGGTTLTWATHCQPYADIVYENGTETDESDRDTITERAVFKVQYDSDTKTITPSDRISHNGYWNIKSARILQRYGIIEIRAEKKNV